MPWDFCFISVLVVTLLTGFQAMLLRIEIQSMLFMLLIDYTL
jgi:hypothetical protein